MTRDPDRDRLAVAKMDAWEAYMAGGLDAQREARWSTYLDAWQALHAYDRAKWNETHPDIQVTPQ